MVRIEVSSFASIRISHKLTLRPLGRPVGYVEPSLIVGVEADVGNRHDWHDVRGFQRLPEPCWSGS